MTITGDAGLLVKDCNSLYFMPDLNI